MIPELMSTFRTNLNSPQLSTIMHNFPETTHKAKEPTKEIINNSKNASAQKGLFVQEIIHLKNRNITKESSRAHKNSKKSIYSKLNI